MTDCTGNPLKTFDINVRGTENIALLCRQWGIPLVFAGSIETVGYPETFPITENSQREALNEYGLTKLMNEEDIVRLADGAFSAHVYLQSNLYGYHELDSETIGKSTVINIFTERSINDNPLLVHRPGTQTRDFLHVKDASSAYLRSVEQLTSKGGVKEPGAEVFPVSSGESFSVLELAEVVQEIAETELDTSPEIKLIDNPRVDQAGGEVFTVDTDRARDLIGFEAERTVENTIRQRMRQASRIGVPEKPIDHS